MHKRSKDLLRGALFGVALGLSLLVDTGVAQSRSPRPPQPGAVAPAPPRRAAEPQKDVAAVESVAARLVSQPVFDAVVARRVPARRLGRAPGAAPQRGRGAGAVGSPAVGGATLTTPLPAGTPRVDARRPSGDVAAFGGMLELRGEHLGGANVKVRFNGVELAVQQRHATLLLCALPAAGSAAVTGKLELSSGVATVSGWTTLHPALRLVPEGELTPRAVVTSITDGPVNSAGLPYPKTRYTTEVTFHEVPGNTVDEFECEVFVPEVFRQDLVVTREFGFNSFKVSIPEAELPGSLRGNIMATFRTSRAGVPGSERHFTRIHAANDFAERARHTIADTYTLRDVFAFTPKEFFGLTQGTSQGLAGPIAVGLFDQQGDLAFRVASAPTGAYAVWVSSLVPLRNGWVVEELEWEESIVHPQGSQPLAEVQRNHDGSGFAFDTEQKYVGWKTLDLRYVNDETPLVRFRRYFTAEDLTQTPNPSPFDTQNRRFVRPLRISLRAKPSPTNNHRATARLVSVVLSGPEGQDWREAFEPGIPTEKGRWLKDTMFPSR